MTVTAALRSATGKTLALSAAFAAVAAGVCAHSVTVTPGSVFARPGLLVGLAITFFLAEQFMVNVEFRRESHSMTFAGVPLVVGVLTLPVHELVLARLVGSLVALLLQRVSLEKVCYNLTAFCFEVGLTATIVQQWQPRGHALDVTSFVLLAVVTAAVDQIMSVLVLWVIRMHGGQLTRAEIIDVLLPAALLSIVATTLGAAMSELLQMKALGALLVVAILVFALLIYRFYAAAKRRHESLETVHQFVTLDGAVDSIADLTRERLEHLRQLLRAASAGAVLVNEGEGLLRIDVHDDERGSDGGGAELDWLQLKALRAGEPTLVPAGTKDAALQRWLADRGVTEAMVVPLLDGGHPIGVVTVTDRMGETTTFTANDMRLLATLTGHLAVALRNARLLERLVHDATHDALTGLHNRAYLSDKIAAALDGDGAAAVLLLDLDKFKEVNDVLGHDVGDRLLAVVAERLRTCVPADATVARLGGDEFAILLGAPLSPGSSTEACAEELAMRVATALAMPIRIDEAVLMPEASVGVAVHDRDQPRDLLRCADTAMYAAKAARTVVEVYRPELDRGRAERLALVADLRLALDEHPEQFAVAFQPKIDLATGEVVSAEALVRWHHPQWGTVAPDRFVPLAEASGLVDRLTTVVLAQAVSECALWRSRGHELTVAVNLSAHNVADERLPERVREVLATAGLPAEALILEITESSVMADPDRSVAILERLHDDGVRLSIDDFGTGYSSLAYLQRLPVDEVKIDRSFVTALDGEGGAAALALVRSIVAMGRNLGLRVVAEGIETERQREELASGGCHVGQGYLFSRPQYAADIRSWLDSRVDAGRLAVAVA